MDPNVRAFLLQLNELSRSQAPENFKFGSLEALTKVVRFDSGIWTEARPGDGYLYEHSRMLYNQPEQMMASYFSNAVDKDFLAAAAIAAPETTIDIDHLMSREELLGHPLYTQHMAKFGITHCLCTALPHLHTSVYSFISLYRSCEGDTFSEEERKHIENISGFLAEGYKNALFFSLTKKGAQQISEKALAICDDQGIIYQQSPAWESMLFDRGEDYKTGKLSSSMLGAIKNSRKTSWEGTILQSSKLDNGLIFIQATPFSVASQLTSTEQTVAKMYIQGRTRESIAKQLHRSPNTIKIHINNIYSKLEVSNKTELANKLSGAVELS